MAVAYTMVAAVLLATSELRSLLLVLCAEQPRMRFKPKAAHSHGQGALHHDAMGQSRLTLCHIMT